MYKKSSPTTGYSLKRQFAYEKKQSTPTAANRKPLRTRYLGPTPAIGHPKIRSDIVHP